LALGATARDLDVQRDLAISVLLVAGVGAGLVLGAVHGDRDDVGSCQAQTLEIGIQIGGAEAAAVGRRELDDADDLASSVCVRGKTVDFGKLVGGECFGSERARLVAAGRLFPDSPKKILVKKRTLVPDGPRAVSFRPDFLMRISLRNWVRSRPGKTKPSNLIPAPGAGGPGGFPTRAQSNREAL
jgi:hypothetical protein